MRKIIHITVKEGYVYALCDDGTVWYSGDESDPWHRYQDIPQDEASHEPNP